MAKDVKIPKVIFYTCTARAFRTTLIGHLYEICKKFPVILLSEELDKESEKILKNKDFFPMLEKIIPINQFSSTNESQFAKQRRLCKEIKEIIWQERPDIIISSSDLHSIFEMCLMAIGKKHGCLNIAIQPTIAMAEVKKISKWFDMFYAYQKMPRKLPFFLRIFLIKLRKYVGYIVYHIFFPISLGIKPFWGSSSYILKKGNAGMRFADYHLVLSQREFEICLADGVKKEKLFIFPHPLQTKTKYFFEKVFFDKIKKSNQSITIIMPAEKIGFKTEGGIIEEKERQVCWLGIISEISKKFLNYSILIKPHPSILVDENLKNKLESIKNVKVFPSDYPADECIEMSKIIVGLPLSASTVLFTASLQNLENKIISLDFFKEILGDCYKNFKGVHYIDNEKDFNKLMFEIKNKKINLYKNEELEENKINIFLENKYENTPNKRIR